MFQRGRSLFEKSECFFCQPIKRSSSTSSRSSGLLDYKQIETLRNYLNDRGKIISRSRTGICAKHQRKLTREIKRARHLALLPFATKI